MKVYVLASLKMEADPKRMQTLIDWLNTGLKQFAIDGHFLNVTSSDDAFLRDARRVAAGFPPIPFDPNCRICSSKRQKKNQ